MNLRLSSRSALATAGVAVGILAAGCTGMQNRPNTHAQGTTWVNAIRNTGSYGNVNAEQGTRVVGERMWQGRKAFVYENTTTGGLLVTELESGGWIAFARGDKPIQSWEPALGWDFPLEVGKSWTRKHRSTNHVKNTSIEFVGSWKVEAYEDVTVRAGTFKAYKVRYNDTLGNESMTWFSPETGGFVKVSNRRSARHLAGAGTNESELVKRPTMP